jgi:hypothetical protein
MIVRRATGRNLGSDLRPDVVPTPPDAAPQKPNQRFDVVGEFLVVVSECVGATHALECGQIVVVATFGPGTDLMELKDTTIAWSLRQNLLHICSHDVLS